jgi:hypothetical protein
MTAAAVHSGWSPHGISLADDSLAVADSGNNRVLLWQRGGG